MTVLPPVKRRTFVDLLRGFARPRSDDGPSDPSALAPSRPSAGAATAAAKRDEIEVWRGYLHGGEEALRMLSLSSIGAPEDEADAELCLVKGEVLRRAGHVHEAERFLRQAPRLASNRRGAAAVTLRAASQDFAFQRLIERADQTRDAAEWREAVQLYGEALRAYPEHYGYAVQLAHCLKEQEQFAEAECHYRSALALGAPRADVYEHLVFVAMAQGFPANFGGSWDEALADGDPLDAPPTKADGELAVSLLLGREPALAEILELLRRHGSLRSLIMAIVEESSFVSANARLLARPGTDAAPSPHIR
jgi:tetratricopeptide (TPR) repeat protein